MSFFAELKRRNVFRVAAAYVVLAWVLLQVGDVVFEAMRLDEAANTILLVILALGLIPALVFAWALELTPEGVRRDTGPASMPPAETSRKLDIVVIILVVIGIGLLAADRFLLPERAPSVAAGGAPGTGEQQQERSVASRDAEPTAPASANDGFIAVLPFANMSANEENEFFADGVTEEILNRLARIPGLNVIARTSSFAFKGDNRDVREIGRTLGAENVLEGSVRRQGNRVRITAQLIATSDGAHLWSETFDREIDDIFAVQDEIAEEVARSLDIVLDETARTAMQNAGIRDVDAFIAYQRGRKLAIEAHDSSENLEVMADAVAEFDRAIERAPEFSAAYLEKSDYYAHLILDPGIEDEVSIQALVDIRELLDRAHALARDPARKAWIDFDRAVFADDWSALPALAEKALATSGCVQGNWLEMLFPFGFEEAIVAYEQHMTQCDPLFLFPYAMLSRFALQAGDPALARRYIEQGEAIAGAHRWLRDARRSVAAFEGRWQELLADLESEQPLTLRQTSAKVRYLAGAGRVEEARDLLEEIDSLPEWQSMSPQLRIRTFAAVGDRETANREAARLDAQPGGALELIRVVNYCDCGAPFDLAVTPNLARRIAEAGFDWLPPELINYPAKDW